MSKIPLVIGILEDIDFPGFRERWSGYAHISPWINDSAVKIPSIENGRVRLMAVAFLVRTASSIVESYARDVGASLAGPEWLWVANVGMDIGNNPLVALAQLLPIKSDADFYTIKNVSGRIDLHVAWGQPAWSSDCCFLLVAPM